MSPEIPKCMKCDRPATHKITKIVKGKVHDLLLCDEHARTFSPYLPGQKSEQGKLMMLLQHFLKQQEELLNSMAGQAGAGEETESEQTAVPGAVCPSCGLSFAAYRKTLLLGCSDCYTAFGDLLTDDLRRMQGATSQQPIPEGEAAGRVGPEPDKAAPAKTPAAAAAARNAAEARAKRLREALQEAIAREDFRAAAQLRDQVRTLEAHARRQAQKAATPKAPAGEGEEAK